MLMQDPHSIEQAADAELCCGLGSGFIPTSA